MGECKQEQHSELPITFVKGRSGRIHVSVITNCGAIPGLKVIPIPKTDAVHSGVIAQITIQTSNFIARRQRGSCAQRREFALAEIPVLNQNDATPTPLPPTKIL